MKKKPMSAHPRDLEATDHENSRRVPDHEPESPVRPAGRGGRRSEDSFPNASDRRASNARTVDSLEDASDSQLLKRLVRTIERSEWDENTVVALLKQVVNSHNTKADAAPPHTALLGHIPGSRLLSPGPRLIDWTPEERRQEEAEARPLAACARWHSWKQDLVDPEAEAEQEQSHSQEFPPSDKSVFIVLGLFEGPEMTPKERVVFIKRYRWFFWNVWWGTVRLRGFRSIFSLKDCTAFRIYTVRNPFSMRELLS
jgi:hypothetical protein